jgi:hypothetical protein
MKQTSIILPILGATLLGFSVAAGQQVAPKETAPKGTNMSVTTSSSSVQKQSLKGKKKQKATVTRRTLAKRGKKSVATKVNHATSTKATTKTSGVMTKRAHVTLAGHVKKPVKQHSNHLAQAKMAGRKGSLNKVQHAMHNIEKHSSPIQTTKTL